MSIKTQKTTVSPQAVLAAAKTFTPTKKRSGKVSVLSQHSDTIRYLRTAKHLSYRQIAEFFQSQGVKITYQSVLNFCNKNKRR